MSSKLYRVLYCSRNRIAGTTDEVAVEIQKILTTARRNNARHGVTGALLYNEGNFAQVLEGPLAPIEQIFEKIQCDPRHSEVTVLESGMVEDVRQFPDWSMAFAGNRESRKPAAAAAFGAAFNNTEGAGAQILQILHNLVLQEDDWILADA